MIVFDFSGSGDYGYAGEDNRTIRLNREAILRDDDPQLKAKLAWYTATGLREGFLLDLWGKYEKEKGSYSNSDSVTRDRMEWKASLFTLKTIDILDRKFGLNVEGHKEYEIVTFALQYSSMTGKSGGFDWRSGRAQNFVIKYFFSTMNGEMSGEQLISSIVTEELEGVKEAAKATDLEAGAGFSSFFGEYGFNTTFNFWGYKKFEFSPEGKKDFQAEIFSIYFKGGVRMPGYKDEVYYEVNEYDLSLFAKTGGLPFKPIIYEDKYYQGIKVKIDCFDFLLEKFEIIKDLKNISEPFLIMYDSFGVIKEDQKYYKTNFIK